MGLVLAIVLVCLAAVVTVVLLQRQQKERRLFLRAARNIVQEELLEYNLKNPTRMQHLPPPARRRTMIFLRTNANPPQRVVYDPTTPITVGRNPQTCTLYLSEPSVSLQHCCIYTYGNKVLLQNQNSANGTILQRGLFKTVCLRQNHAAPLRSGDRIRIGSFMMKVRLFLYDDAAT